MRSCVHLGSSTSQSPMASVRDCVIDAIWGHQHRTRSSLLQSLRCLARPLQDAPRVCRAPCLARPLGARLGLQPTDVGLTSHRARASDSIQRGSAVWARPLGTRFGLQPTRWSCLARALGARLGLHPSRWAVWRFPGARLKLNPTRMWFLRGASLWSGGTGYSFSAPGGSRLSAGRTGTIYLGDVRKSTVTARPPREAARTFRAGANLAPEPARSGRACELIEQSQTQPVTRDCT